MAITRYCKRTMHSYVPCKLTEAALPKYKLYGIEAWHHCLIVGTQAFFYIWDTRIIEHVLPVQVLDQNDLTYKVLDNRMDIICITNDDKYASILSACEEAKYDAPIQFIEQPLSDNEQELIDPIHV